MSKKDFDSYMLKVTKQYKDMKESLEEIQEAANEGLASPEMVDNVKLIVKPIMDNYMTLSYVKYLLDIPAKKQKLPRYKSANEKFLKSIPHNFTDEGIVNTNNEALAKLKIESDNVKQL